MSDFKIAQVQSNFLRDFTVRVNAQEEGKDCLLLDFVVQAESEQGAVLTFWSTFGSLMYQQPKHLKMNVGYIRRVAIVVVFDNEPDEAPQYPRRRVLAS